jgi:translation initiation factor IF-1
MAAAAVTAAVADAAATAAVHAGKKSGGRLNFSAVSHLCLRLSKWPEASFSKGIILRMKEELIELVGVVVDKQPNAYFKVQVNDTDHFVLATISGRMRRNRIRILMGDRVDLELSPYDLTKGRITYRHK